MYYNRQYVFDVQRQLNPKCHEYTETSAVDRALVLIRTMINNPIKTST